VVLFCFVFKYSGLNSGLLTCKAGSLLLEPHRRPFFDLDILEIGSHLFAQVGLHHDLLILCFPK
jgi:hypothetical protein